VGDLLSFGINNLELHTIDEKRMRGQERGGEPYLQVGRETHRRGGGGGGGRLPIAVIHCFLCILCVQLEHNKYWTNKSRI